jgi:HK97 family phage portal protein
MIGGLTRRVRSLVAKAIVVKATEGQPRPGPYYLPVTGGVLSATAGSFMNWWQMGYTPASTAQSAMVEACISAYSQTIAMCPGDHWLGNEKGGRDRQTASALSRILRHPNSYQSMADFMLNLTRQLYLDGNAYALCFRNSRYEIDEMHLMESRLCLPIVAQTGDIFYQLGGNNIIDRMFPEVLLVPQRDVLHVRLHSGTGGTQKRPYPIRGESPLVAALGDMAIGDAILQQQINFYMNQARPSAVLSTELNLDREQVQALRDRWNEQVKSIDCGAGGTPILTNGLKVMPWSTPGKDAQIADMLKLSNDRIALAFRVPLQVLGVTTGAGAGRSTDMVMHNWIATGLGFALNQIEEAFGLVFNLYGQPDEYVEFGTSALLRSAFKDRIDGLARAVQGGILSPNEARNLEGYEDVKFGDEPRVQQQVVPLSAAAAIPTRPIGGGPAGGGDKIPPAPSPPSAPPADAQPAPRANIDDLSRQLIREADKHDRRHVA